MNAGSSKLLSIGLLALLLFGGGAVGYVIGARSAADTASNSDGILRLPRAEKIERFSRRLKLTSEQRTKIEEIFADARNTEVESRRNAQTRILEVLGPDQRERYNKILHRRSQRRGKRDQRRRPRRNRR